MPEIDEVVSRKTDALSFDFHLPLMSLPGVFEDSLETIPKTVPYLGNPSPSAQPPAKSVWHGRLGQSTVGSPLHPGNRFLTPFGSPRGMAQPPMGPTAPGSLHDHSWN